MKIGEARKIAFSIDCQIRGWTSADYKDSIDTSGFLQCDGSSAEINWDRVEEFATEVAARAILHYANSREIKEP